MNKSNVNVLKRWGSVILALIIVISFSSPQLLIYADNGTGAYVEEGDGDGNNDGFENMQEDGSGVSPNPNPKIDEDGDGVNPNTENDQDADDANPNTENDGDDANPNTENDQDGSDANPNTENDGDDTNPNTENDGDDTNPNTENDDGTNPNTENDDDVTNPNTDNNGDTNPNTENDDDGTNPNTENDDDDTNPNTENDDDTNPNTENDDDDTNPNTENDDDDTNPNPDNVNGGGNPTLSSHTPPDVPYIQALQEQLYNAGAFVGDQHIEWLLTTFGADTEFIEAIYYAIENDPGFAALFLEETYALYREDAPNIIFNDSINNARSASQAVEARMMGIKNNFMWGSGDGKVSESDDYITDFSKIVTAEGFRHYNVGLSLNPEPEIIGLGNSDVMLIVDVSLGASQLNLIKSSMKTFAKSIFGSTDSGPYPPANGSHIGFISYHGGGILDQINPVRTYAEFEQAVNNMGKGNNSSPKIQEHLITAKYALGVKDGQFNPDTKKAIVFMTANDKIDTSASSAFSDRWTGSGSNMSLPIATDESPQAGAKRWSYIGGDSNRYFSGPNQMRYEAETVWTLNSLEGQYTVAQGVDIYVIGYDKGATLLPKLKEVTWKMTNPPSELRGGDKYTDYAPSRGVDSAIGSSRAMEGTDSNIEAVYKSIAETIIQESASSIEVRDTLSAEFEVLVDGSPIPLSAFANGDSKAINEYLSVTQNEHGVQQVLWNVDKSASSGSLNASYQIRVRDQRIWEQGRGLSIGDGGTVGTATETSVSYSVGGSPRQLSQSSQPKVTVAPLISGTAGITDEQGNAIKAALAGDSVLLSGGITSGNGDYSYQWSRKAEDKSWMPIKSSTWVDNISGAKLNINLAPHTVTHDREKSYEYLLAITDNIASLAGYVNPDVIQANCFCGLKVFEPVLTVGVVGDARPIEGQFETRVSGNDRQWYFMGSGIRTYGFNDGIKRGIYSASVYVPYGYSVSLPDSKEIQLIEKNGEWTGYSVVLTLLISKTDPAYFYDWAWPESVRVINGLSKNIAFPTMILSANAHGRRRFK